MFVRLIAFLLINFFALYLGQLFTDGGVVSSWYSNLNKAPWTPPGWVFGFSWTMIMLCFSFFMAYAMDLVKDQRRLFLIFGIQFLFNVGWNPTFFYFNNILAGLIIILLLTALVVYMLMAYKKELGNKVLLLLPYIIWLIIATSLNAYALVAN